MLEPSNHRCLQWTTAGDCLSHLATGASDVKKRGHLYNFRELSLILLSPELLLLTKRRPYFLEHWESYATLFIAPDRVVPVFKVGIQKVSFTKVKT